jgi:hypothetical protein
MERSNIHEVVSSKRDIAIAALERSAFLSVRGDQLADWVGPGVACPHGTQPFMLRSMSIRVHSPTLEVLVSGDALLVSDGALGNSAPMKMPLIACLANRPSELYVVFSRAK